MSKDVKPITGKLVEIPLAQLHIRYIPMAELERWWDGHYYGHDLMSLVTSPHVEIMTIFLEHGFDWKKLKRSRYANERRYRAKLGMPQWTKEFLKNHFRKRYALFKSIKKHGFKPDMRNKRPVEVLKKPFWNTRFMLNDPKIKGLEVWNGGGASSACLVLGCKTIPGIYVEDVDPGSMKCKNLTKKFKHAKKNIH